MEQLEECEGKVIERVSFKIDGEYITNLARVWFWDERKDYSICEELLLDCLVTDEITLEERKQIAQQIIEGRKKLVGINKFDLVDDNKNIRPMYQMINQLNKEAKILEIENDIQIHAINYVDIYSTKISYKVAKDDGNINTYNEVVEWFSRSEDCFGRKRDIFPKYIDSDTMVGLWLLDRPKLIYDLIGEPLNSSNRDKFFEKLYDYIGEENLSQDMRQRQEHYKASMRTKKDKEEYNNNLLKKAEEKGKEYQEKIIDKLYHSDKRVNINDMTIDEYAIYLDTEFHDKWNSIVKPDDIEKSEGLIDKQGNYYSCGFGGHNIKAYRIMCTYYQKFGFNSREEAVIKLKSDKALDNIIKAGWISTRYLPTKGNYLEIADTCRPTKAQINKVWDTIVKYDIHGMIGLEKLE